MMSRLDRTGARHDDIPLFLLLNSPAWSGFALQRRGFFKGSKMSSDKFYKIKYSISTPERTGSGRAISDRGNSKTFSTSAADLAEAKHKLRQSTPFKTAKERAAKNLNFQEGRSPRVRFDKITEQPKKGNTLVGKPKVVQESAFQKRVGGGRAAAINETMGRTPKDQIRKIMPKT